MQPHSDLEKVGRRPIDEDRLLRIERRLEIDWASREPQLMGLELQKENAAWVCRLWVLKKTRELGEAEIFVKELQTTAIMEVVESGIEAWNARRSERSFVRDRFGRDSSATTSVPLNLPTTRDSKPTLENTRKRQQTPNEIRRSEIPRLPVGTLYAESLCDVGEQLPREW